MNVRWVIIMNKEPIRILCVFSTLDRGGSESMCMNLYRNIDRSKVQFDFIKHTEEKGYFEDEIISLGGRIYAAPRFRFYNYLQYRNWWMNHFKHHPEHLIIHGHYTTISAVYLGFAKKMGRITIGHSHSSRPDRKSLNAIMKDIVLRGVESVSSYCFACGKEAGEWLFPHRKFKVLNNAVDSGSFSLSDSKRILAREEFGIKDELLLGHIGRMDDAKNQQFAIRVLKEILSNSIDAKLLLVGDGQLRYRLEELAKSIGIRDNVLFTGVRSDIADLTQAMDVFVFPSIEEGLPVTVIEAQAAGLKCFISEAVTREVDLTGRCEFLPINDPKLWAEKIMSADLTKVNTSEQIRASGYDIHSTAKWLEKFYLKIAERSK